MNSIFALFFKQSPGIYIHAIHLRHTNVTNVYIIYILHTTPFKTEYEIVELLIFSFGTNRLHKYHRTSKVGCERFAKDRTCPVLKRCLGVYRSWISDAGIVRPSMKNTASSNLCWRSREIILIICFLDFKNFSKMVSILYVTLLSFVLIVNTGLYVSLFLTQFWFYTGLLVLFLQKKNSSTSSVIGF